jgi:phospholipid/cholesterol/gamma-HCH transport system substrate-binding protein
MTWLRVLPAIAAVGVLGGCSLSLEDLPAPAGVSGPTYHLTAEFRDVQNLTVGAKVKLGGVLIGEVDSIGTHDYRAEVHLSIERKFALGPDATFEIRFTTPLGEDYVAATPGHPGRGRLPDGGTVPLARTSDAPNIEDTFSAVSTLLNGGGLDKLQTIATELDTALRGRTGQARDALINLQRVVADLDANKDDIDRVLDGLRSMASALNRGTSDIERALDLFPPALQSLAADTGRVKELLTRVATLGDSVQDLLARGQQALFTDLDNLRPTRDSQRARQRELVPTMNSLIRFGRLIDRATPGDYVNLAVTIQFLLNAPPARPHGGVR